MKALIKRKPTGEAWYTGLELVDRPEPAVSVDRPIKVRVLAAGICGTDVGLYQGKASLAQALSSLKQPDVVLGHEFCAVLEDVHGSAREALAQLLKLQNPRAPEVVEYLRRPAAELAQQADLVAFVRDHFHITAEMHFSCGRCLQCLTGQAHVCQRTVGKGLHEDGAFAKFMLLPLNRIVLIEQGTIPLKLISFMDALGNAVHTGQSVTTKGSTVLITGAGVQGLMSTAVARALGASKIFVTDVVNSQGIDKLALATALGADHVFDVGTEAGRTNLVSTIERETNGAGVDAVFEMSGNYVAYEQAFRLVRMGGTVLLLGLPAGTWPVDFSRDIIFRGVTVKGIYGRRIFATWDLMKSLLRQGLADVLMKGNLVTHELPLEQYEDGFQALSKGQAIKVLLLP